MNNHNTKSLGDAIKAFIASMKWEDKINETTLINEWDKIIGSETAKYTTDLRFKEGRLTICFKSATLRYELMMKKKNLIDTINNYFGQAVVRDIDFR
ncbi:MAG: DUF721 domain-containing protein [Bacteroidales bacterium]|nr:DUF721 domain-containing protein [Bacteroidales bacterium]